MPKALFICKQRADSYGVSYGLFNSARFVSDFLKVNDIESEVVSVADANGIDRAVTRYNPTHVFIEAIWVPPPKFRELLAIRRHARRRWVIRIHSKIPFLANEGIAFEWLAGYKDIDGLWIAPNTAELVRDLREAMDLHSVYLPNVYQPQLYSQGPIDQNRASAVMDIGCFGAIRPLKNTLIQAVAAIRFANQRKGHLRFHINGDRIEQNGVQVLKNLEALFADTPHELVKHSWMSHADFVHVVRQMDLGLQVSLSESFNIVVADFVANGIPVVVSPDVDWMPRYLTASPNSSESIVQAMSLAWGLGKPVIRSLNKAYLGWHNRTARRAWLEFLRTSTDLQLALDAQVASDLLAIAA